MTLTIRRHSTSAAFSLIEAVIVMGIIAVVVGAIWAVMAQIVREQRVNETAQGILYTAAKARKLLPISTYPSTFGTAVHAGTTLNAAKAYPPGWNMHGNHSISPMGTRIEALQSCWDICPMFALYIRGPADTTYKSNLTAPECTALARRVAALTANNSNLYYIQIWSGAPAVSFYPPFTPADITCPADFVAIAFWFNPMP